jgi:uncharacterized protein YbgA (DUF1722 family)/uncharacterized protein YbbK (DUF523 family)
MIDKPVVVLSHCLGDCPCRYNGQAIRDPYVALMADYVDFKPVCPEVAIGLGVPRNPIRLVDDDKGGIRLVQPATDLDVMEKMRAFAGRFLDSLGPVDGFMLKGRSPSCGIGDVKVHSADGKRVVRREAGVFAAAVRERFPGTAVEEEGRLNDFSIRDHFLTRVFTSARFRGVRSMSALVAFQASHKLLLMAHNQSAMRELGRVVANPGKLPLPRVLEQYARGLGRGLARPAKAPARINVFEHAYGYFSGELSPAERRHYQQLIGKYRASRVPVGAVTTLLRSWTARFQTAYLAGQVLFEPYPEELVSLLDSGKGREP